MYLWLKAFHVAAMVVWIGGMLILALVHSLLRAQTPPAGPGPLAEIAARWDTRVTTPAMLSTWALGVTLAVQSGWFGAPWLSIKLAIVGALSILHGIQSGTLRRQIGTAHV